MRNKVPYETIVDCKAGDNDAMIKVLKHYEPIIVEASKRTVIDEDGQKHVFVDDDIRRHIEQELILKIFLKYDITRKPRNKRAS